MASLVTCDELGELVIRFIEAASQEDKDRIISSLDILKREYFCKWINAPRYYASQQVSVDLPNQSCTLGVELAKRVGYAFHPSDFRDPDATVEFRLCEDDVPRMFLYPDSTPDHNIELLDCGGGVIGYALNKPFIMIAPDFEFCDCK